MLDRASTSQLYDPREQTVKEKGIALYLVPIRLRQGRSEHSCYVHTKGVGHAHRLELVEGCAMGGMLGFQERYGSEKACLEALARLR